MALNSLFCADVPLSNYSLTHSYVEMWRSSSFTARDPMMSWYLIDTRVLHSDMTSAAFQNTDDDGLQPGRPGSSPSPSVF